MFIIIGMVGRKNIMKSRHDVGATFPQLVALQFAHLFLILYKFTIVETFCSAIIDLIGTQSQSALPTNLNRHKNT